MKITGSKAEVRSGRRLGAHSDTASLPRSAGRPGRRPGPQQTVQNFSQHNPPVQV